MGNSTSPLFVTAFAALVALGCGMRGGTAERHESPGATLAVHNTHWTRLVVYLERGGTLIRVGTIGSSERRTFRLGPAQVGSGNNLRLVVESRVSRERHRSIVFSVSPGQRIYWTIQSRLELSNFAIR